MELTNDLSTIISVETIRERDIDLLILEELMSNDSFRQWVLEKTIGLIDSYEFVGTWHSLSYVQLDESDLVFKIVKGDNERILFLLENKIDAEFQLNQAVRYKQRGEKLKAQGQCDVFYTILIAPKEYIVRNEEFDFYLEYEEIREWFLGKSQLGDRAKYKADILYIAIEKLRRGYSPIVDEATTNFWWAYYRFVSDNYPHLRMRKPRVGIPSRSNFILFEPMEKVQIVHKGHGAVDLILSNELQKITDKLTSEMEIVKFDSSSAIRITVSEFDTKGNFTDQQDNIKNALDKVDVLYQWAKENL